MRRNTLRAFEQTLLLCSGLALVTFVVQWRLLHFETAVAGTVDRSEEVEEWVADRLYSMNVSNAWIERCRARRIMRIIRASRQLIARQRNGIEIRSCRFVLESTTDNSDTARRNSCKERRRSIQVN